MDTVECRSDTDYAERPLAVEWLGRRYEVAEILARWRGPLERGFRVKTAEGQAFDLTYQDSTERWHVQPL